MTWMSTYRRKMTHWSILHLHVDPLEGGIKCFSGCGLWARAGAVGSESSPGEVYLYIVVLICFNIHMLEARGFAKYERLHLHV